MEQRLSGLVIRETWGLGAASRRLEALWHQGFGLSAHGYRGFGEQGRDKGFRPHAGA